MDLDISQLLITLLGKYPWFSTAIFVIGALRVVVKPIFSIARAYVDYTPDVEDNKKLDSVEQSSFVKGLFYVLDWFASIKLDPPKK